MSVVADNIKTVSEAQMRGRRDFRKGLQLEDNPYRHYPNSEGCIRLMAWWDAGYQKEKYGLK